MYRHSWTIIYWNVKLQIKIVSAIICLSVSFLNVYIICPFIVFSILQQSPTHNLWDARHLSTTVCCNFEISWLSTDITFFICITSLYSFINKYFQLNIVNISLLSCQPGVIVVYFYVYNFYVKHQLSYSTWAVANRYITILWIGLIYKWFIDYKFLIILWTKHDITVTLGWQDSTCEF